MITDKDHKCGLWGKENLHGKSKLDIRCDLKGEAGLVHTAVLGA